MPRNIRRVPKVVNEDMLGEILEAIDKMPSMDAAFGRMIKLRDKTAICLMFYCGLRPLECLSLKVSDIDFDHFKLNIRPYFNKERNDTPAVLTEPAKKILLKYLDETARLGMQLVYLFPSLWTWKPITRDAFGKRFQMIMKEAGINEVEYYDECGMPKYKYNLYTMRHSFCTQVYKKTGSEEAVTQLARHTKPESAHVYIHLDFDAKKQIADKVFSM